MTLLHTFMQIYVYVHADICSDFELSHGNFTVEGNSSATVYTNGTRVTLFCDEGYGPTYGSDVVTCLGGAWLPARPECNCELKFKFNRWAAPPPSRF